MCATMASTYFSNDFLTCAHIQNVHIPCNCESLVPPFHHQVWTADMEIRLEKTVVTLKRKGRGHVTWILHTERYLFDASSCNPDSFPVFSIETAVSCASNYQFYRKVIWMLVLHYIDLQYLLKTNLPAVAASLKVTVLLTHWYAVLVFGKRNKIQMSGSINQVVQFYRPWHL